MKIRIFIFILNISLFSGFLRADENKCPSYLVNFWNDFSTRNGVISVPAFLIANGCIIGPIEIVHLYQRYLYLLDNQIEVNYFGNSYEAKYYKENYNNDTYQNNDEVPINEKEIVFQPIESGNSLNVNDNQNDFIPIHSNSDKKPSIVNQPVTINLYFITIKRNDFPKLLLSTVILLIFLSLTIYYKRRTKNNITRQYKEKVCPDCGSKVKPGKHQCFICGSYV